MTSAILLRGRVLTPFEDIPLGAVLVEEGRVAWVRPGPHSVSKAREMGGDGFIVAPGFIDLQVNGLAGHDLAEGRDAVEEVSQQLPRFGVTAFLPTLVSRPLPEMLEFVGSVSHGRSRGARILGAHLEGPFLNPNFAGVHDKEALLEPNEENVWPLAHLRPGLRMLTLAPELPGAIAAIPRLRARGIVVSAGHTGASYEEAMAAIDSGLSFGTHLFNAMRPFAHREPGIVGALLTDPRVRVGLIPDGVHLHPSTLQLVVRLAGSDRVCFTTDQTAAAAAPAGRYRLAGSELISDGRSVRSADGKIGGSIATMDGLVRSVAPLSADLASLMKMTSATPAGVLGEQERLGVIAPGRFADLVVLDQDLHVAATLVGGEIVYEGSGSSR